MEVSVKSVKDVGYCNYCDKSNLRADGKGLEYPYDEVFEINGTYVSSRMCFDCAKELGKIIDKR